MGCHTFSYGRGGVFTRLIPGFQCEKTAVLIYEVFPNALEVNLLMIFNRHWILV